MTTMKMSFYPDAEEGLIRDDFSLSLEALAADSAVVVLEADQEADLVASAEAEVSVGVELLVDGNCFNNNKKNQSRSD